MLIKKELFKEKELFIYIDSTYPLTHVSTFKNLLSCGRIPTSLFNHGKSIDISIYYLTV